MPRTFDEPSDFSGVEDRSINTAALLISNRPFSFPERDFGVSEAEISTLREKGVRCSEVQEARWGSVTKIRLPGGSEVGLYQPKHPSALSIS